jgi:hypothetical protein
VFARAAAVMGTGTPALSALAQMGCSTQKLRNLPYFVDLDAVVPHLDPAPPSISYVSSGRLHADKATIWRSARSRRCTGGSGSFTYTIAGTGPEREALVASRGRSRHRRPRHVPGLARAGGARTAVPRRDDPSCIRRGASRTASRCSRRWPQGSR